jgi:aspartyl-tRNA(Asn)/glutamyl-tRNA(Gln) amidotransferase subunit A
LCGVVGFKPTAKRVPLDGAFPLSPTLDSIGPLANSVECCAIVDSILANEAVQPLNVTALRGLRLAVPQSLVLDAMDDAVAAGFSRALAKLSAAGAEIVEIALPEFLELPALNAKGGIAPPEAYAIHRAWIEQRAGEYDPRVVKRILRAKEQDAADYIQLLWARSKFIKEVGAALAPFDAMAMPTVPLIAPPIASLADDASYARANGLMLRNTSIVNFLDGCAISIPCHDPGTAPVGLMLAGLHGADKRLLSIAAAVERHL